MGRSGSPARWFAAFAFTLLAAATHDAFAAKSWKLIDLGTLGGSSSFGMAVNDAGAVVGCSEVAPDRLHAFIYRDGSIEDLGTASSSAAGNSCAFAVNDAGEATGRAATGEVAIWSGGSFTNLGFQGTGRGINDQGLVVGEYRDGQGLRAFALANGKATDLGALGSGTDTFATAVNREGEIVGGSNGKAFLYAAGAMHDLGTLGGSSAVAKNINERGVIVGMASNAQGQPTAFLYREAMTALAGPGYASAVAVDERDEVLASAEGYDGFIVEGGKVTRLDSLPAVRAAGWHHMDAAGMNDRGWIVGTGDNIEGNPHAFLLVPGN